jgi:hypothetical protein
VTSVAAAVANVAVAACTWPVVAEVTTSNTCSAVAKIAVSYVCSAIIEVAITTIAAMASELTVIIDTAIVVQTSIVVRTSDTVNSTIYVWSTAVSLCNTCRTTSSVVSVVATIPTVAHSYVMVTLSHCAIMTMTSFVPASASIMAPTVSAAIGSIEVWTTEVEVVTTWVMDIDSEVPVTSLPIEWTVEIGGCTEQIPLP